MEFCSIAGYRHLYQYDHVGRRISKTSNGITTYYRYNGDDIDAEYSATWTETARYVHGPGMDDPLMRLTGQTNDRVRRRSAQAPKQLIAEFEGFGR